MQEIAVYIILGLALSFLIIKAKEIETTKDYGINQLIIEEIKMFERALKKRAFNNKTHSVEKDLKYNCKMRFDPRYDLCNCCNSYIPIKSKNCEYCSDEIISDNNVIERRLSGKW